MTIGKVRMTGRRSWAALAVCLGLALAALSYVLVRPMVEAYKHRRRRELQLRSESEALGTR